MAIFLPENQAVYNTKIKVYPNGYTNTTYCNFDIFKNPDFEEHDKRKNIPTFKELPTLDPHSKLYAKHIKDNAEKRPRRTVSDEPREDNLKRAKEKIFDIVLLNDFKYFITGTFSENEDLDRSDPKEVIKPLMTWLRHRTERNGLQYVLTSERHKESNGIHIHALVNDVLPLTYSGRRLYKGKAWIEEDILKEQSSFERYKQIFNIDDWKFGWSTAIPCDENKLCLARYVTKYITKEDKKIFGKYYWSSKNIEREPKVILTHTSFDDVKNDKFAPVGTSYRFKYDAFFSDMEIDLQQNTDDIIAFLAEKERIQGLL